MKKITTTEAIAIASLSATLTGGFFFCKRIYGIYRKTQDLLKAIEESSVSSGKKNEESVSKEDTVEKNIMIIDRELNNVLYRDYTRLYDEAVANVTEEEMSRQIYFVYKDSEENNLGLSDEEVLERASKLLNTTSGEFIEKVAKEHYRLITKQMEKCNG